MNDRPVSGRAMGCVGSKVGEWLLWGAIIAVALGVLRWIDLPEMLRRYGGDIVHLAVQHSGWRRCQAAWQSWLGSRLASF